MPGEEKACDVTRICRSRTRSCYPNQQPRRRPYHSLAISFWKGCKTAQRHYRKWSSCMCWYAVDFRMSQERSKVDWGDIALEILKRQPTAAPLSSKASTTTADSDLLSTSSSTSSSSSSTTVKRLCASDQTRAIKMFEALDPNKMWKLSTGTMVEEQLALLVKECNFEQWVVSINVTWW